ncbi:hypothetical protein BST63_01365, partial [Bradyrhizobium canariense]
QRTSRPERLAAGRDQIGKVGDIVSESTGDFISVRLGDFVGIRNVAAARAAFDCTNEHQRSIPRPEGVDLAQYDAAYRS